jgi:adenylate cyclase
MLKQYSQALPLLRNYVSKGRWGGHAWLAATYARLGQLQDAREHVAEILRLQPDYTISRTARRTLGFKSKKDDKHYFDGLRKAGLPE